MSVPGAIFVARPEDAAQVAEIYAPNVTDAFISFEIEPPTAGEMRARIALPNDASVRLHEAVGFTPVGIYRGVGYKQGAWRDVGWWARQLGEPAANPDPPKPFRS